jgi:site-specific recombinase XerC
MSTYTPKNYSKIQTICTILTQYAQQTAYNYEQVDILEASLETLHAESLEAESIRQQLDSVRGLAAQTAAAEAATVIRLRAIVDELIPLA